MATATVKQPTLAIEDGQLVVRIPLLTKPKLSKKGNSYIVGSTEGWLGGAVYNDNPDLPIRVNCNAIISKDD